MDRQSVLVQTVAEFIGTDPGHVGPDFPLAGPRFQGSLARTRLYAAIQQRLGVKCRAVYAARTYGELQAAVFGTPADASGTIPVGSASSNGASQLSSKSASHLSMPQAMSEALNAHLSCGIDLEMVEHFPEVRDYWEDAFYATAFTPAEIAYCLMQEHPRMHFAARWCAKEALKKCDPAYAGEDMGHFEVAFDKHGAPFMQCDVNGTTERLPVVVSMSHTPSMAVAMVIRST